MRSGCKPVATLTPPACTNYLGVGTGYYPDYRKHLTQPTRDACLTQLPPRAWELPEPCDPDTVPAA